MKNDADVLNALLKGKIIDMIAADGTIYCSWHMEGGTVLRSNSHMPVIPAFDETIKIKTGTIDINDF